MKPSASALDDNRRLMQELQHRIKNHIGIITSLVRMRARSASSDDARLELAAVGERVEALRLVHEQLYVANSAEQLRLRPYVMQLVENLCHLHKDHSGQVRLEIEIQDVDLGAEAARDPGETRDVARHHPPAVAHDMGTLSPQDIGARDAFGEQWHVVAHRDPAGAGPPGIDQKRRPPVARQVEGAGQAARATADDEAVEGLCSRGSG